MTDRVQKLDPKELEGKSITEINKMLFVPKRDEEIADTIRRYWEKVENPRMLVFCPSIPHAEYFANLLPGQAKPLHSKQSLDVKNKNWQDFRSGKINTLLAVDMLNEGIDVPDVNIVVFLRSTESRAIYFQQVGRGLRLYPGKDKTVFLDFVASWERLNTLMSLDNSIADYYKQQGVSDGSRRPIIAETNSEFHYSAEALQAIETIRFARGEKQRPRAVKERPRVDEWAIEEAEIKQLLGLSQLPNQRITNEEWASYAERILGGDQSAIDELTLRYLRTAYSTSRQYAKSHPSAELAVEDYFQTAIMAVYEKLSKLERDQQESLRKIVNFSVFRALQKLDSERGVIKLPGEYYKFASKFNAGVEKLAKEIGEAAVDTMDFVSLAQKIGFEPYEAKNHLLLRRFDYSEMLDVSEADSLACDTPSAFDIASDNIAKEGLLKILDYLSYRERKVLQYRFGIGVDKPKSLEQTGKIFNVTQERIRQIENQALKKLQSLDEASQLHLTDEGHVSLPSNELNRNKADVRNGFKLMGSKLHRKNKPYYDQMDTVSAGIAYFVHSHLNRQMNLHITQYAPANDPNYFIYINKNDLFEVIDGGSESSYNDFIKALHEMNRLGLINCVFERDRPAVIEGVKVTKNQLQAGNPGTFMY